MERKPSEEKGESEWKGYVPILPVEDEEFHPIKPGGTNGPLTDEKAPSGGPTEKP